MKISGFSNIGAAIKGIKAKIYKIGYKRASDAENVNRKVVKMLFC